MTAYRTAGSPSAAKRSPVEVPPAALRVRHVIAPARVGGAESVVRALVAGLRERGYDARVAVVTEDHPEEHPFVRAVREAEIPVDPVVVGARAYLRQWREIRRVLRSGRPDVVHTHGHRSDLLDARVARRLGIPVVATVHGFTGTSLRTRLYRWLQRRAYRHFDGVAAVSWPLARELVDSGVPRDRVHLVPNARTAEGEPPLHPDEARRRLGAPEGGVHVGWVGRLGHEKGGDVLVKALARLGDVPWTASFVGEGEEGPRLRRLAEDLGLDGRVRWHGEIPRAQRLFSGFDVFVLSSRREGTPIVLLEAMAAGVPVVATSVGGVPDVVSEDEAYLVPPDDPDSLAAAIRRVAARPDEARTRAERARARLEEERGADAWIERYVRLYRQALARRAGAASTAGSGAPPGERAGRAPSERAVSEEP